MNGASRPPDPLHVTAIVGNASGDLHDAVHALEHAGRVEFVDIPAADAARRRLRAVTDRGREVTIALARDVQMADGAVLALTSELAVVLRVDSGARLVIIPEDLSSAMRLGHWCGNLHWKVDFGADRMSILLDGPEDRYRDRLRDLQGLARFRIVEDAQ